MSSELHHSGKTHTGKKCIFLFVQTTFWHCGDVFFFIIQVFCLSAQQLPILLCSRGHLLGDRFI